ncbi:hypothetical protein [Aurantiacibacter sediminis]|uniref:DUF2178 domain-containing protein n=1 Tax=Aurantiacibacter sediminis TaxID=2793064 RepID=A0ABS0MZG0_9SPHN|nr:hypothetical protein [Aurantiacibacter sediminis]MBH5321078.1 hypothetical protein [Aurantiacibacter sediminis]
MTDAVQKKPKPGLWAGLFAANLGIIAALFITGALEAPTPYILFALNFLLLIPMIKAGKQAQEESGAMTRAMRDYNRRFLVASALYAATMLGAGGLTNVIPQESPAMWLLAIAPMLPAFGMIWAITRYLREETDEYQRYKAVRASMVGLGFVLVLGTGWGFLETFGLVPHIWAWWVFPAWAMGLALGMVLPEHAGDAS